MTESLADILSRKGSQEPPEIEAIKQFVFDRFQVQVRVGISNQQIIIQAPSAALAATLRLNLPTLQQAAKTKARIVIRIG
jgi:hypothetical protein